jgi:hypothetical protein
MSEVMELRGGMVAVDGGGQQWIVGRSTGRTAHLHKACIEVDHDTLEVVKNEVETGSVKFVNGSRGRQHARISHVFESFEAFVSQRRKNIEAYKEYKRREREKAEAEEAEMIAFGKTFFADERNTVESWDVPDAADAERPQGRKVLLVKWHRPLRGVDGVWLVTAFVDKPYSWMSTGATDRSVSISAQHTGGDLMSSRFMTSGTTLGDTLEAALAAVMKAVERS